MGVVWSVVWPYALGLALVVALVRTRRLRELEPGLALRQRAGLVLLTAPIFTLLGVGLGSLPSLGEAPASAASPDVLASKALVHLGFYLAVPVTGIVLTLGERFPDVARRALALRDAAEVSRGLRALSIASASLSALVLVAWSLSGGDGGLLAAEGASLFFSQTTPIVALGLSVIAAFAEELCFRGVLMAWLKQRVPVAAAIGVQALAFGLIHAGYGSVAHVLAATAFGVLMGVLVQRTGLAPAIATHLLVNLVILSLWSGHAVLLLPAGLALLSAAAASYLLGPPGASREVPDDAVVASAGG